MKDLLLLAIIHFSYNSQKSSKEYGKFPLSVPRQNSFMAKWEKNPVLDSRLIDDIETDKGWKENGIGEMSYAEDRAKDSVYSIREIGERQIYFTIQVCI